MTDIGNDSVLLAAVTWFQQTLLGTIATTIAIVAVASVGYSALSGRMPLRRGITVVVGCFILFGATSIAAGASLSYRSDFAYAASALPVGVEPAPGSSGRR